MYFALAQPADTDAVMDLVGRTVRRMHELGIYQWGEAYPTRDFFERDIARESLWAARDEGALCGIVTLNDHEAAEYAPLPWSLRPERVLVVHRLAVHPDWHGRGVARALMAHAEQVARRDGRGAIRLDTFSENPIALGLYDSLGYRRVAEFHFPRGLFIAFEKEILPPP